MGVYYILFLLIIGLGILLTVLTKNKWARLAYLAVTFGFMWFLATFRNGIGYDYQSYIDIFNNIKSLSFTDLINHFTKTAHIWAIPREPGFALLTFAMSRLISSPIVMYGVYSFLILAPVAWFINKYCKDVWLSVWLYVSMVFFFNAMNFIRQSLACSISLFAFDFFRKRKTIPFILVVLVAATFHITALILIPIYFVTYIKLSPPVLIGYSILVLVLSLTSDYIIDFVTDYFFTSYKGTDYVNKILGASFIVIPLFIVLALVALYPAWKNRNPYAELMLKIAIISATFWLFGSFKHMIVERLCMYGYIYSIYSLPSALRSLGADPAKVEQRELLYQSSQKSKLPMSQNKQLSQLTEHVQEHNYYYWSAVAATVIITLLYIYSGRPIVRPDGSIKDGFHNVIPYKSVFGAIAHFWR